MQSYLPFRPTKGSAFRLFFSAIGNVNTNPGAVPLLGFISFGTITTVNIDKDGAGFTTLTNAPVETTTGSGYVDLTATEMNADVVTILLKKVGTSSVGVTNIAQAICIYTTTDSGSGLTNQNIADIANAVANVCGGFA